MPGFISRRGRFALAALTVAALGASSSPALPSLVAVEAPSAPAAETGPAGACRHPWVPPVDAPVIDRFRPPDRPFGPGNRGLQYDTDPGQPVRAVDAGVVTFAGPVGGAPVLVVDHGGGLRSSSVVLVELLVARGQSVSRGQEVAVAGAGFHLGARLGPRYLDPAELIERRCVIIRSLPLP